MSEGRPVVVTGRPSGAYESESYGSDQSFSIT
jgi:hypothetical protein